MLKGFYIRKADRLALLYVLLGLAAVAVLFHLLGNNADEVAISADKRQTSDVLPVRSTTHKTSYIKRHTSDHYFAVPEPSVERFYFDPNTADSAQLLRLGLKPWQVKNVYRYRAHGGVFRKPSDFARLYGLTAKQYRELEPYIQISADYQPAATQLPQSSEEDEIDRSGYQTKLSAGEYVTLNNADTTALKTVPGIGSYYARRIANYGQRLGGYVSTAQLKEIEGFPEEALPYFQVDAGNIQRLSVNTLSLSKLRQHPYLNFYQARAIIDYRRLKGALHSIDDLRLLPEFPPEALNRLQPYLSFEETK